MHFYQKLVLTFAVLALPVGCSQQAVLETFIPKQESAVAQRTLSELIIKNLGALDSQLDPSLKTPETRDILARMVDASPQVQPKSTRLAGTQTSTYNGVTTYNLTYEYEYPDT